MRLKEYKYKNLNISYREGTEDELVLNDSFDRDIFLKELPYINLEKFPTIVDVGAHIGTFSIYCSQKFNQSKIYSFEASQETFQILEMNIKSNNLFNKIKGYNKAVWHKNDIISLYHNLEDGNWGHTVTKKISESFEQVNTITLPNIIVENNIKLIDIIKLNCEGAEFDILLNTEIEILKKIKLSITLYHCDLNQKSHNKWDIIERFEQAEHKCITINETNDRGWIISINKRYYSPLIFNFFSKLKRKLRVFK